MTQYQEAFIAAAVDGAFLYDLNDDDLKSSLGVEHRLHRKKILNSIERLKAAETERARPVTLSAVRSPPLSETNSLSSMLLRCLGAFFSAQLPCTNEFA